jgi:hypothetical protein
MAEISRLKRYNPRKRVNTEKMAAIRSGLIGWVLLVGSGLAVVQAAAAQAPSQWEKPAAALAEQISGIMGPGQAQMAIRNISSVPAADVPGIRKLIEQDLKVLGVVALGAESANAIRVTLSENTRERLWVAEVVQGNETRVAMVEVAPAAPSIERTDAHIVLRKERLSGALDSHEPILFAVQARGDLVILHTGDIEIGSSHDGVWNGQKRVAFGRRQIASRDPRGVVTLADDATGFTANSPGIQCTGSHSAAAVGGTTDEWSVECREGDDPWPLPGGGVANETTNLKAFFNAGRNYFTGVVTPAVGVDLPPFYSAGFVSRPAGVALLINGIDGKVQMVENGALKAVTGTRDWGSDFAVLHSGCGTGTQMIASESGPATSDSLRAYEISALEAVGTSAPLNMDGAVTALWTTQDGKSVLAVVRSATDEYEVDRVTALCN